MFKLILKFQDTVVEEYEFHSTPVTIGRRDDNNVVIDNMAVSGHHAVIEEEGPELLCTGRLGILERYNSSMRPKSPGKKSLMVTR